MALTIFLVPQLGAAMFIALLITGQMLTSVAFDHFGWLGSTPDRPVASGGRRALIAGVLLIRR